MNQRTLISEFVKNSNEKVKAEFVEFHGKDLLSLWVYYKGKEGEEDWRPSRKGLCLRIDQIPQLKAAIDRASEIYTEKIG